MLGVLNLRFPSKRKRSKRVWCQVGLAIENTTAAPFAEPERRTMWRRDCEAVGVIGEGA
ncbi:hypothetical protein B0H19DRAFT_1145666 [Mycena capillaripes]|nr:hypothetical protein B0H19DRAFT_1145666 [Mycena capillaripes]